jgi:hypothetical protein
VKNLLVATINHNDSDGRIKIVLRKKEQRYQWYEDDTNLETACPAAESLAMAKQYAMASWGSPAWQIKAKWLEPRTY